jgi:hypothetical protein
MSMRNEFERAVLAWKGRRRQWQTRAAATAGSALLIFVACWSAGVFDRWREWFAPGAEVPVASQGPAPVIPTPPVTAPTGPRLADDGAVGKMRLVATQPGRNTREGTAQLATGNADPLTYIAGALLANGTSLVEVFSDHVVLKRGDSTTELYLDGMARTARGPRAAPASEALITVDKPAAKQERRAVGPETYASIVRTAPRFVDNTVAGFEVYPGTDAGALSRLNLQSGDVLLEIDGRVLKSVEQLHGSLESIRGGASLMATVQRGSEQLVLTMDGTMLKVQQSPALPDLPPR